MGRGVVGEGKGGRGAMRWVVRWLRIFVGTWGGCVGLGGCGYE